MAQYIADFGTDTLASPPAGWTANRWVSANSPVYTVLAEPSSAGNGQIVRHTSSSDARNLISFDAVDADADRDDIEVLVRWRSSSTTGAQGICAVRASGGAATEDGYIVQREGNTLRLARFVAGTNTNLTATTVSFSTNTWYWFRVRAIGSNIKVRGWAGALADEPATWGIDYTDGTPILTAGWAGIFHSESTGNHDVDIFGVATNSDTVDLETYYGVVPVHVTQQVAYSISSGPADVRVTQAVDYAITTGEADVRITQTVAYAICPVPADTRITQMVAYAIVKDFPCIVEWAQLWKITRPDGVVLGYTDRDVAVEFRGVTFQPCGSLATSAVNLGQALQNTGSLNLQGIIDDDGITVEELEAGVFDGAQVEVFLHELNNTTETVRMINGFMSNAKFGVWSVGFDVVTLGQLLQQRPLVQPFTPSCRWTDITDSRCGVDFVSLTQSGTVTNVGFATRYEAFTDSGISEVENYFTFGKLTWLTGNNVGVSSEVRYSTGSTIVLAEDTPYEIEVGDTFEVYPGCNKTSDHCVNKFSNMINYGGFPDVPGQDSINQTPNAKQG